MMTVDDLRVVMSDLATSTKRYIAEEITGVLEGVGEKIAALEAKLTALQLTPGPMGPPGRDAEPLAGPIGPRGEKGDRGEAGRDGLSVDPVTLQKSIDASVQFLTTSTPLLVRDEVGKALATWERPRDGAPGRDGASVTLADVQPIIRAAVAEALAEAIKALPTPAAGRDGLSVTADDLRPVVAELVTAGLAAIPPARDGRDGLPGVPGLPGEKGEKGMDGSNGSNGNDGQPGKDGADGIGFDNLSLKFGETSGYVLEVESAGRVKTWPMAIPWDAGVWRQGRTYPQGAGVTFKGNWWIAQSTTANRPSDTKDWRLSVRRGEDGKDAKKNVDGSD